jgi:hypothetical protein
VLLELPAWPGEVDNAVAAAKIHLLADALLGQVAN